MKNVKWIIILCILNIAIVAGIISWVVLRDNSAPLIEGPKEGIYKTKLSDEEILSGVTATDDKDGDVSDTLVVEKVILNEKTKMATVICGAKDKSGNISRKTFRRKAEIEVKAEDIEKENKFHLDAGEAANNGNIDLDASNENEDKENSSEESSLENNFPEQNEEVIVGSENLNENTAGDEDQTNKEAADSEEKKEEQEEDKLEKKKENKDSKAKKGNAPILQFSKGEIKTKVGLTPAWVTVIGRLEDDTDQYEELLHSLTVKGEYKKDQKGSYAVTVTVNDKDGNESAAVPITIIVEG